MLPVTPGLPINEQLVQALARFMGESSQAVSKLLAVRQDISFAITLPHTGREATVYVGSYSGEDAVERLAERRSQWSDLPSLIRKMPKNRLRLVYLKALQTFAGMQASDLQIAEIERPC